MAFVIAEKKKARQTNNQTKQLKHMQFSHIFKVHTPHFCFREKKKGLHIF